MPSKSKRRVTDDDSDAGTDHGTERQKKPKLKHTKGEGLAQRSAADDVPGDGARDDDGAAYWEVCFHCQLLRWPKHGLTGLARFPRIAVSPCRITTARPWST